MCLAVPMKVTELLDGGMAHATAMGAERDVAIDLTPQVQVGDYVLVHAGFAIEIVDEQYAQETLDLIQMMADMVDDPLVAEGAMAR
ncbi:MAG: HypC/HybG/HupF family hydrogenase formation chaperone [Eggerthellaceae bacterium]|nr:HypC/HybG/HupF family hydrogenase formation chaperone [Eggerthellaceae bacterium]